MAETQYLTIRDVSKRLKIAQSTIFTFMRQGIFPRGVKFGKARRWLDSDVDQWAAAQAKEAMA